MKDILTKKEVAEMLQVSKRQVERLIATRKLVASRLSHKIVRIRKEEVDRYLRRTTI